MRDINEFATLLRRLDRLTGSADAMCFHCNVRQISVNIYAYDYDALTPIAVRFNADGTVNEWCDLYIPDVNFDTTPPHNTYSCVDDMVNEICTKLRY